MKFEGGIQKVISGNIQNDQKATSIDPSDTAAQNYEIPSAHSSINVSGSHLNGSFVSKLHQY